MGKANRQFLWCALPAPSAGKSPVETLTVRTIGIPAQTSHNNLKVRDCVYACEASVDHRLIVGIEQVFRWEMAGTFASM